MALFYHAPISSRYTVYGHSKIPVMISKRTRAVRLWPGGAMAVTWMFDIDISKKFDSETFQLNNRKKINQLNDIHSNTQSPPI